MAPGSDFSSSMSSPTIRPGFIGCGIKPLRRRISRACGITCSRCRRLTISNFNRAEQKAYWINVYNAITVELILSRYPVASIRDINISPGLIERGPWGAKLFSVEGEKISLDDIEHRILRPIWKDSRIHYALNCASLGSPNLQPAAYTNENTEALLERGAKEFVNHPRGVSIQKGKLQVSSLYIWFQEDFGRDAEDLMEHWQQYANPALADALGKYSGGLAHDYDWRLNGVENEPAVGGFSCRPVRGSQ